MTDEFDLLEPAKQAIMLSEIVFGIGELPVIAYVRYQTRWLLITTKRVIPMSGHLHELSNSEIAYAAPPNEKSHFTSKLSKANMSGLSIIGTHGRSLAVELEPGPPLLGIWHILNNIGSRNRHSPRSPGNDAVINYKEGPTAVASQSKPPPIE